MNIIVLGPLDLGLAALLVLLLAGMTRLQGMDLAPRILIAAGRAAIQLTLIGLVLKTIFRTVHPGWLLGMALVMLAVASREVMSRQDRPFLGWWGIGIGAVSMFVSSFVLTVFALKVILSPSPWYMPQYAIPLLGMMLGNTMTSIALGLDRLTREVYRERGQIEARLMLGHSGREAMRPLLREAVRAGMIPSINAMAAAGVVSLPGMMTGQILAGNSPMTAVNYQILILFMITAGAGFGVAVGVWLGGRRLFDERQRLRLDRLKGG